MVVDDGRNVQNNFNSVMNIALDTAILSPLDRQTLGDRAYVQISDLLIAGKLAPGDKLSLRATAEMLGVSMMPVREAVTRMVADRALEVAPNRAVRVPILSAAGFRDLTSARIAIEGHAAAEATRHASKDDKARLRASERAFRELRFVANPDLGLAVKLNQTFHFDLYRAARSPVLIDIIRALWLKAGPVINLDLRANPERLSKTQAVEFHAGALKAVLEGDEAAARDAISQDIRGAAAYILAQGQLIEDD